MFPFRKKSLVQLNVVENELIILCYCFKHLNKTLQRRADVVDFFLFCSPTYEILIKVPALVSLCAGQPVSSKSLVEKNKKKNGPVCLTGLAETRITLLAGSEDLLYQPR